MVLTPEEREQLRQLQEQEMAIWRQLRDITERVADTYESVYKQQTKEI